ncbi:MAG: hypothetical protein K6G65_04875 [Lachnospiraceae bacterium]|nr:hypothetical protein [Lachnospiraceae bacterium]
MEQNRLHITNRANKVIHTLLIVFAIAAILQSYLKSVMLGTSSLILSIVTISFVTFLIKVKKDPRWNAIGNPLAYLVAILGFCVLSKGTSYVVFEAALAILFCMLYFDSKAILYTSIAADVLIILCPIIFQFPFLGEGLGIAVIVMHMFCLIMIEVLSYFIVKWMEEYLREIEASGESSRDKMVTVKELHEELTGDIRTLNQETDASVATIDNVAEAIREMQDGAYVQSDNLGNIMVSVEGIEKQVKDTMNAARGIEELTKQLVVTTDTNLGSIQGVKNHMDNIRSVMRDANTTVQEFSASMNEISEVLSAIKSISAQTNLLALNASIESARAGEAGRGFAVVADEVRKLSEETQVTVDEIDVVVTKMQGKIQSVIDSVESGDRLAETGQQAIVESVEKFDAVKDMFAQVREGVDEQYEMVKNVDVLVEEVRSNVENSTGISEKNTETTQKVIALQQDQQEALNRVKTAVLDVKKQIDELDMAFREEKEELER